MIVNNDSFTAFFLDLDLSNALWLGLNRLDTRPSLLDTTVLLLLLLVFVVVFGNLLLL